MLNRFGCIVVRPNRRWNEIAASNKHNSGFLQENDNDDDEESSYFEDLLSDDSNEKSSFTVMKLAKQSNLYKK